MTLNFKTTYFPAFGQYLANSTHRCCALTFASARLSCKCRLRMTWFTSCNENSKDQDHEGYKVPNKSQTCFHRHFHLFWFDHAMCICTVGC